ncbi:MAG: hypothetical protein ACFB15_25750 [Cyclobacteriaceae bacterium]
MLSPLLYDQVDQEVVTLLKQQRIEDSAGGHQVNWVTDRFGTAKIIHGASVNALIFQKIDFIYQLDALFTVCSYDPEVWVNRKIRYKDKDYTVHAVKPKKSKHMYKVTLVCYA